MGITRSKRTKFTGAHLSPEVQEALKTSARKKRKSVSAVVSEAVEEKLEREAFVESIELPPAEPTQ